VFAFRGAFCFGAICTAFATYRHSNDKYFHGLLCNYFDYYWIANAPKKHARTSFCVCDNTWPAMANSIAAYSIAKRHGGEAAKSFRAVVNVPPSDAFARIGPHKSISIMSYPAINALISG